MTCTQSGATGEHGEQGMVTERKLCVLQLGEGRMDGFICIARRIGIWVQTLLPSSEINSVRMHYSSQMRYCSLIAWWCTVSGARG